MAEETSTSNESTPSTAKAAAKRKTAPRKSPANSASSRKAQASAGTARKAASAKATPRKTTRKNAPRKASPDIAARAREASRGAFLASLGFYGKAFDQVQDQFNTVQSQLESRRKKADKLYAELVKRGEKVEKKALRAIDEIDLPRLELTSITDRKQLEARLGKVRQRFSDLRDSVGFSSAA